MKVEINTVNEEKTPEIILGKKLRDLHLSVSTAESCSGGAIAHKIVSVEGASDYFKGGIVAYSNQVKENLLHVDSETLEKYGAVSRQVVEKMAENCANLFQTDCAIAVSGIAGPSGGTKEKPVGTVWICTRCRERSVAIVYNTGNSRAGNIERSANLGILQLIEML